MPATSTAVPADRKEYRRILADLYGATPQAKEDLYARLMAKETRVLEAIERVSNADRRTSVDAGQFVHMPIAAVALRFQSALREIAADVAAARTGPQLVVALRKDDRIIYAGLLLIVVALFLLLLQGDP